MDKLLSTDQKGGLSVQEYIDRFHNLSLMGLAGMPLPMLLQTCRQLPRWSESLHGGRQDPYMKRAYRTSRNS